MNGGQSPADTVPRPSLMCTRMGNLKFWRRCYQDLLSQFCCNTGDTGWSLQLPLPWELHQGQQSGPWLDEPFGLSWRNSVITAQAKSRGVRVV